MKPTLAEAEAAVRTLIAFAGDDPDREGLRGTPSRVCKAYAEWFGGYAVDAEALLSKSFGETAGYDAMVIERGIRVTSHCEHHMAPIIGTAAIGYIPQGRVVGISKLARVVQAYAQRLQIQERLTQQIATALMQHLKPLGVGVVITAQHGCMITRGCRQPNSDLVTSALFGVFREVEVRTEFLALVLQHET